jgi:Transposase DDE domain group 1
MTKTSNAPGTRKVRRATLGSKRAPGWQWQNTGRRVRRANVRELKRGADDQTVSGIGGLVDFNAFVQRDGLGRRLAREFGHLKDGKQVVYPMHTQMQLLIDAAIVGARRVFDFEWLALDPVFEHLAGGAVPSVDTLYDDLRRFGPAELEQLEAVVAEHGLRLLRARRPDRVTVDIDTTVTPLFGHQEGAVPGSNPRYHGRPSYHPIVARVAETDTIAGARLRPGDTALGDTDVEDVEQWLDRIREAAGAKALITVRIDAGGDCAALLGAIHNRGAFFVVKAKQTANLLGAAMEVERWNTVDVDASGNPSRQAAELDFQRKDWPAERYRVIAIRTNERDSGRQVFLWDGLDLSIQFYVTNDHVRDIDDLARTYDDRAGIEPLIGELKNGFGIGKASSSCFNANEAAFLIKLLAYNLMRRWVAAELPASVADWRSSWIRRAAILIPARLLRSGGRWIIRRAPRPMLN